MIYITNFENDEEYNSSKNSLNFPNISVSLEEHNVYYNPYVATDLRVIVKYNVTSASSAIGLYDSSYNSSNWASMEVDGVEVTPTSSYTFDTTGEHTVKFTLAEGVTSIGNSAFSYCSELTSITISDSVTSIGDYAFSTCSGLMSITIPDSVTSIGSSVFYGCSGLTSITCNITTAPTISANTFQGVKSGGTLTVPAGSTGYDVWMGTGNYYLGKYGWTKVEQ